MARRRRDALRAKLEKLAEKIADEALQLPAEEIRDKVNALKAAGAYWGLSRKGEKPDDDEGAAWGKYASAITGKGNGHDAAEDQP